MGGGGAPGCLPLLWSWFINAATEDRRDSCMLAALLWPAIPGFRPAPTPGGEKAEEMDAEGEADILRSAAMFCT